MNQDKIIVQEVETPIGNIQLGSYREKLCMCDWPNTHHAKTIKRIRTYLDTDCAPGNSKIINTAYEQLQEYFVKARKAFDVPTLLCGTDLQLTVWNFLMNVPYGSTMSYQELAVCIGKPGAVRAVANAVGANPISIIIPCHRVIGSSCHIGGYAGGIDTKLKLLKLESENNEQ